MNQELAAGAMFYRRLNSGRESYRHVVLVRDGKVVYLTNLRRGSNTCQTRTFLRWAGGKRRCTPKPGPLC